MKVRADALVEALAPHGFRLGSEDVKIHSCFLFRPSRLTPGLFEGVGVFGQGKRGEFVYASVSVDLTRWCGGVDGPSELLRDVRDPETGSVSIRTAEQARAWVALLARYAPLRCEELAARAGPALLERTKELRAAVERYLAVIPAETDTELLRNQLWRTTQPAERTEAERIGEAARLIHDASDFYDVAALTVVRHSMEVEGRSFVGVKIADADLNARVQLITDALLARDPSREGSQ